MWVLTTVTSSDFLWQTKTCSLMASSCASGTTHTWQVKKHLVLVKKRKKRGGFQCLISPYLIRVSTLISSFLKSKQSIRTAQHDLHVKICLETKFYIFWNFFTIFLDLLKIAVFQINLDHKKTAIFNKSKKIVKKISKI